MIFLFLIINLKILSPIKKVNKYLKKLKNKKEVRKPLNITHHYEIDNLTKNINAIRLILKDNKNNENKKDDNKKSNFIIKIPYI